MKERKRGVDRKKKDTRTQKLDRFAPSRLVLRTDTPFMYFINYEVCESFQRRIV